MLEGHFAYFGITGNYPRVSSVPSECSLAYRNSDRFNLDWNFSIP